MGMKVIKKKYEKRNTKNTESKDEALERLKKYKENKKKLKELKSEVYFQTGNEFSFKMVSCKNVNGRIISTKKINIDKLNKELKSIEYELSKIRKKIKKENFRTKIKFDSNGRKKEYKIEIETDKKIKQKYEELLKIKDRIQRYIEKQQ